jgi:hypothetical protein
VWIEFKYKLSKNTLPANFVSKLEKEIKKLNPDYSRIILTIKLHLKIGKIKTPNFGCSYPDVKSGGVYLRELTLFGFPLCNPMPIAHSHLSLCSGMNKAG